MKEQRPESGKSICFHCKKPVIHSQLAAYIYGLKAHIDCVIEDEENVFFDRDMDFGDQ